MSELDFLTFVNNWQSYLNLDSQLVGRIAPNGISPMLDGSELIELNIGSLPTYTIVLRERKFHFEKRRAQSPLLSLNTPLSIFKEMLGSEHRVIWTLMDDRTKFVVASQLNRVELMTLLQILVASQELWDKSPEVRKVFEDHGGDK